LKKENSQMWFSATDLVNHLGCEFTTHFEQQYIDGEIPLECRADSMLDLLIELGNLHETAYLDHLREQGLSVVELTEFGGDGDREKAVEAMQQGVDVIAQVSLVSALWRGRADFLIKVDRPSKFGNWSYEVADTKLSQSTKASAVLQLCLYSELLAKVQGVQPDKMHVVKPGRSAQSQEFEVDALRVNDYLAYFRMAKSRFESNYKKGFDPERNLEPCAHCQVCNWWPRCNQTWREADHLSFVAGITKSQRMELEEQQIITLEGFANSPSALPALPKRGSIKSFQKTHLQAKIQLKGRGSGKPEFEFNEVEKDRGFQRLPEPNEGDVFFDIEGNPRGGDAGLEYLFGFVTVDDSRPEFHKLWALSKYEEKKLFEKFIDIVMERWRAFPDMHIFHFAPYEPSALKRLATRHATRENELDQLLRGKRFVDLYAVAKQGIRASVESYSIKQLEQFYGFERLEVLEDASKALREMERLIALNMTDLLTEHHRSVVETYNRDDCLSTLALRNWLEELRSDLAATGLELDRLDSGDGAPSEEMVKVSEEIQAIFDSLTEDVVDGEPEGENQNSRWLLAHMLEYFRREDKCTWWEYFRTHDLDHEELLRDRKGVSGLRFEAVIPGPPRARTPIHRYSFAAQEVAIKKEDDLVEVGGDKIGTLVDLDLTTCTIDIKKRGDSADVHPSSIFAFSRVGPEPMPESILEFGKAVVQSIGGEDKLKSARFDLLLRRPPRLKSLSLPMQGEKCSIAIALANDLDNSTLAIQGPPGAGKTFIGSNMITDLARRGKKIGVTAGSHKVILNLLESVHRESQGGAKVLLAHKPKSGKQSDEYPSFVTRAEDKKASLELLEKGYVVGGTAWLWANELMEQKLDYLFIDEAGQMSLAVALAAGRAAKNIVLLGDPQQLEQPQQGAHPEGAGVAALSHVLNGEETMPADKGLFLDDTWRLHPAICDFVSEQYYEGRLDSVVGLERQSISGGTGLSGSGLRCVSVEHLGNQSRSDEEVTVINELFRQLIDGTSFWTDKQKNQKPITLEDILVVAPFNAQVSALTAALPAGARVGTVDKFQGQEAPIVIYSMTSSSVDDAPRGMSFLFSRNRMNVATSRARCLVLLVGSPDLFKPDCSSPEQIRLANGLCRFLEMAKQG